MNMKNKGNLFIIIFSGVFLFVGIIFLATGIITFFLNRSFAENAEEIPAMISEISSYRGSDHEVKHRVYVTYTYAGRTYGNIPLNFYSSNMYEGKEILILCDPENPEHIGTKGGVMLLCGIFSGMGLLFTGISLVPIGNSLRKASLRRRLRNSGRKLYATVEEIVQNRSLSMNGRHPYVIYCTYRDDYRDTLYRFKSSNIWTNPDPVLHPGDTIPVYVEEANYRHYFVDTESIINRKIEDYT